MSGQLIRNTLLRQLAGAGWAGIIGVTLCMFAMAFAYSGNGERKDELAAIAEQRAELARQMTKGSQSEPAPREILNRFRQGFPAASALPDILMQLDAGARKHGLAPRRADYSESNESLRDHATPESSAPAGNSGFRRMRISIPVQGSYEALRGWLSNALTDIPSLSIESIDLQRQKLSDADLQAQIRLIVYLRSQP